VGQSSPKFLGDATP